MAAADPVEELAFELRMLLRMGAVDLVDPAELRILHHIVAEQGDGLRPRVVGLQPMLDLAIAGVADEETRLALEILLGQSDFRYRSMKERGTRAAKIVGVGYDAYRRVKTGRIHSDLLWLAAQIAIRHPDSTTVAAVEPIVEQHEACELCGSEAGHQKLRTVAV